MKRNLLQCFLLLVMMMLVHGCATSRHGTVSVADEGRIGEISNDRTKWVDAVPF